MALTLLRAATAPLQRLPRLGGGTGLALPARPDARWRALKDVQVEAGGEFCSLDLVAAHPAHGLALVVVGRGEFAVPHLALRVVRAALREDGFGTRFPGFLPVVFLSLAEAELPGLPAALQRAFEREAPVEIDDPEWSEAALGAIAARSLAEPAPAWETDAEAEPFAAAAAPRGRPPGWTIALVAAAGLVLSGAATAVVAALSAPAAPPAPPLAAAASVVAPAAAPPAAAPPAAAPALAPAPAPVPAPSASSPAAPKHRARARHAAATVAADPAPRAASVEPSLATAQRPKPHAGFWPPQPLPPHLADR
jgi:hypothetical protein